MTLFPKVDSWIFGSNIPGKERAVMFYMGGLANYPVLIMHSPVDIHMTPGSPPRS